MKTGAACLLDAVMFAAEQHRNQRRKDAGASPYINHPIALAHLLATTGGIEDLDVLRAAILHDTIEDTETTEAELRERFGDVVTGIVMEVTDDKALPKERRKELQVEHAPHKSSGAALVKLADKICNLQDVAEAPPTDWSLRRRQEYFDWAKRVVDGLPRVSDKLLGAFEAAYSRRPTSQLSDPTRRDGHELRMPGTAGLARVQVGSMDVPSIDEVMESITTDRFRASNWHKHRTDQRYPNSDIPFWNDFASRDGNVFTRRHVFAHFDDDIAKGVVSAIMWGYPTGGRPGGVWKSFSEAFRTAAFPEAIAALRTRPPQPASEILSTLNRIVPGVGTATTTKVAYFAKLKAAEPVSGMVFDCVIYDSMVRRAIANRDDPDFAELKAALNGFRRDIDPLKQEQTYGLYLRSVNAAAYRLGVRPDQIELFLFNIGRELPPLG